METFLTYTLKTSVCFAAAFLLYKLFLGKENRHGFNRSILLGSMTLSTLLPFFRITWHKTLPLSTGTIPVSDIAFPPMAQPETNPTAVILFWSVYGLGSAICLASFLFSVFSLLRLIRKGEKQKLDDGSVLVFSSRVKAPFNWMNFIILPQNETEYMKNGILSHEKAHRHLHHSWDILFAQIFIAWQWFNPVAYLFRDELKNLHEFEADEKVLESGIDAKQYQLLLVKRATGFDGRRIANGLNRQALKKRIAMMSKTRTPKKNAWKALYLLPLVGISLIANARTEIEYVLPPHAETGFREEIPQTGESWLQNHDYQTNVMKDSLEVRTGTASFPKTENVAEKGQDIQRNSAKTPEAVLQGDAASENGSSGPKKESSPEIYLNNRRITQAEFEKIDIEDIESIRIYKDKNVIRVVASPMDGEKSKNRKGKKNKSGKTRSYPITADKNGPKIIFENQREESSSFHVKDLNVNIEYPRQKTDRASSANSSAKESLPTRYYINDKEVSRENLDEISAKEIESVRVNDEEGYRALYFELKKNPGETRRKAGNPGKE